MNTMSKERLKAKSRRAQPRDGSLNTVRPDVRKPVTPVPAPRIQLVESEEYEWTSSLNLPSLIALPALDQTTEARQGRPIWPYLDGIIETEDGDAASFRQLPGLLESAAQDQPPDDSTPSLRDEAEWGIDEYAEIAAMQLPGLLVEPIAVNREPLGAVATRGLCSTCVHQANCSFPRPSGGVWRCEEYA